MPSKSKSQHNLMEAVAHSDKFSKKVGVPQAVGQEFANADIGKKVGNLPEHKTKPAHGYGR